MRRRATGLLALMTVVFIVARAAEEGGEAWVGYVRAMAEAAMVGGLADWFAVTALFRYPLGIPIPHTAIIPSRKDQIGRSLGEFLQANFLSGPVVAERIVAAHPGERLAEWLQRPGSPETVARHAADALAALSGAMRDDEVHGAVSELVMSRLEQVELAPVAGKVLSVATEDGRHQEVLDSLLRGFDRLLVDQRDDLRSRFDRESPWWVPEALDGRIFEKLYKGLRGFLAEVVDDPKHELRGHLDERLRAFAHDLQHDPELRARGEELKLEMLAHPALRGWTASMWADAKAALAEQALDPESTLRRRLSGAAESLGERLVEDPALRAKVDDALARFAAYVLDEYADTLSEMIESTVERWDPEVVTGQLELLLGRDLQFIRINGTVVGGFIGLVLHATGQVIG